VKNWDGDEYGSEKGIRAEFAFLIALTFFVAGVAFLGWAFGFE